jgi:hypothetical protein
MMQPLDRLLDRAPHEDLTASRDARLGGLPHAEKVSGAAFSKNETPKSGLGDQGTEWGFCIPIRDTETKQYARIATVPPGFEGLRVLAGGDRTGWLGRQDSKLCIRMIVIRPERFRRRFAARCSDEMLRLVSNQ